MENLKCGAAIGDITPLEDEFYGLEALQRRKIGGVLDPIHVRVISLNNEIERFLFICFELDKAPYPKKYKEEINAIFGIKKDNIFLLAAHVHSMPVLGDRTTDGPNNIAGKPEEVVTCTHNYENRIHEIIMATIKKAIETERNAVLGFGVGESYINVDRKCKYTYKDENGTVHKLLALGQNRNTPINHDLCVFRFDDLRNNPIAFIVNYPVHCTVLHGNSVMNGKLGISADIAGVVSSNIEKRFRDSVCIWTSGAAGDINPAMMCELTYPNPQNGVPKQEIMEGDTTYMLRNIGAQHLEDVKNTIAKITCNTHNPILNNTVDLCISDGKEGEYIVQLHMLRVADKAILSVSGELFSSYKAEIERVIGSDRIIIINHDCSLQYNSGYIPDKATMLYEECWLPGIGSKSNIVVSNFYETFIKTVTNMYQSLFAEK